MLTKISQETAKAIYDTLKDEYLVEERRHAFLISKTQTLGTVASLLFVVFSFSKPIDHGSVYLSNFALLLGIAGTVIALYLLKSRGYSRIRHGSVLNESELEKAPEIILIKLAKTYDQAINESSPKQNQLASTFNWALGLIVGGCLLEAISIGIQISKGP